MFRSSHFSFFVFGHFWRPSYENITQSLFTFCKVRWTRRKKMERKSRNESDQNTKRRKYGMNKTKEPSFHSRKKKIQVRFFVYSVSCPQVHGEILFVKEIICCSVFFSHPFMNNQSKQNSIMYVVDSSSNYRDVENR